MHVKVKVEAGARREKFEIISTMLFKISVKEKAEGNAANRRVVALVAHHFKIPQKSVRIVNGHHAPSKLFSISGYNEAV